MLTTKKFVRERITKLQTQWETLTQQSQSKSRYLKESNQLQQYNNNVKELDYWLSEVGLNDATHLWLVFSCVVCYTAHIYIAICKKMILYIFQTENLLSSEDCGHDLASTQNLLKKHQLVEVDITAHQVSLFLVLLRI